MGRVDVRCPGCGRVIVTKEGDSVTLSGVIFDGQEVRCPNCRSTIDKEKLAELLGFSNFVTLGGLFGLDLDKLNQDVLKIVQDLTRCKDKLVGELKVKGFIDTSDSFTAIQDVPDLQHLTLTEFSILVKAILDLHRGVDDDSVVGRLMKIANQLDMSEAEIEAFLVKLEQKPCLAFDLDKALKTQVRLISLYELYELNKHIQAIVEDLTQRLSTTSEFFNDFTLFEIVGLHKAVLKLENSGVSL